MPMINFNYNPTVYPERYMKFLAAGLEEALREAIVKACPSVAHQYNITIEGRAQGPIAHNLPDLTIRIDYHQEWEFADRELDRIAQEMKSAVEDMLREVKAPTNGAKIRMYALTGYKSAALS